MQEGVAFALVFFAGLFVMLLFLLARLTVGVEAVRDILRRMEERTGGKTPRPPGGPGGMRTWLALLLTAGGACATSPAEAVELAWRDAARLPPGTAQHCRYLSLYHISDPKKLAEWEKVLNFWCASLSRQAELYRLHAVRPGLWRLDLRDYGYPKEVWEKLFDPYFMAKVKLAGGKVVETWPGGVWPADGKYYAPGAFQVERQAKEGAEKAAQAPWLNEKSAAALVLLTQSQAPIVRADWWLVQSAQQVDRKGTGYYDFLQVKDLKEFQRAVGLDQKLAEELQKETRAIVNKSGVALQNRQILRFQTITGGYWATLDSNKSSNGNNAARQLNGDYQFDATEVYGVLPSGLFAFFLADSKGVRQDAAPDSIASDGQAPGNDRRVHVGVSCVRCHTPGIQPISDWGRRVYRSPLALASPDYEKARRLQRLYLSDLEGKVKRDQADYAEVVLKLTGLKPSELARAFAKLHESYQEADVDLAQAAREVGCSKPHLLAALKVYAKSGPLDPVLAGLLQVPEEPIIRSHFEEAFPLVQLALRGYQP